MNRFERKTMPLDKSKSSNNEVNALKQEVLDLINTMKQNGLSPVLLNESDKGYRGKSNIQKYKYLIDLYNKNVDIANKKESQIKKPSKQISDDTKKPKFALKDDDDFNGSIDLNKSTSESEDFDNDFDPNNIMNINNNQQQFPHQQIQPLVQQPIQQQMNINNNFINNQMAASNDWKQDFFKKDAKQKADLAFERLTKENIGTKLVSANWDYLNPYGGKLGNREVRYNRNLLNPDEFASFWKSGKKSNYRIFNGVDTDGDGQYDMIAMKPDGHIVGFNERYVTEPDKGETPYRRDYYQKYNKDQRKDTSYMEYLDSTNPVQGWRDINKIKENRSSSTWKLVYTYLDSELKNVNATKSEAENICKRIVRILITAFFATDVPSFQIQTISSSPEFKKILKTRVTSLTIGEFIPNGAKQGLVNGMLQKLRGYGGNIETVYANLLTTKVTKYRISKEDAEELYENLVTKKAANKLYKETGLSPMTITDQNVQAYKTALAAEKQKLKAKYETQTFKLDAK